MKRSKQKKQLKMEEQDAKGISRKKWNHTIDLELFVTLKFICIVAIPIVYFVYSPLLIVFMIGYVSLFFLAIMAERGMNTSIVKSNHIKIPKLDSALALILVVIAIFGMVMSGTSKNKKSDFKNIPNFEFSQKNNVDFKKIRQESFWNGFVSDLKTFGSILTGERSIFGNGKKEFGKSEPPKDFVIDKSKIPEMPEGDFPSGERPQGMPNMPEGEFDMSKFPKRADFEFSMNDIPVEYMFSSIATTVISVLIFSVSGCGLISLIILSLKKKKFERVINEILVEEQVLLTDEEIEKLLEFGEIVEEKQEIKEDIIRKDNHKFQAKINNENVETQFATSKEDVKILKDDFDIDKLFDE